MKLRITKSAVADLQAIQAYYKELDVSHIGNDFVAATLQSIEILPPDACRVVPKFNQENIRELTHAPFRLVYLRQAEEIVLIRVWRSERLLALPDSEL